MNTENEYTKRATDFLTKTKTEFKITFLRSGKHFDNDKEDRDIYEFEFVRGTRKFKATFGNSINCSGEYIGHKNMCTNEFGKYKFSKAEFDKLRSRARSFYIYKNPNFEIPTAYSVLACLTKYDVGSFEDFCSEFGYDEASRTAEKTYKAICDEYLNVCKIWSDDEIELLQEIN